MRKPLMILGSVITGLIFLFGIKTVPAPVNEGGPGLTNANRVPLAFYRFRERNYVCSVMESNYVRTPSWQSDRADPPLSPRSALEIAERYAWRVVPDAVGFKAQEIVLKRFAGIWFYIVELEPSNTVSSRWGGRMQTIKIPVLMDGTVVERIEQNETP